MNPTTLFIAQVAGPLFVVLGLAFMIQKDFYADVFKGLAKEKSFYLVDGIAETLIGIVMVLSHNLWVTLPEIVVSLLGWAVLVEGVLVLLMGKAYIKSLFSLFSKDMKSMMVWSALFSLIVGGYLVWVGYLM